MLVQTIDKKTGAKGVRVVKGRETYDGDDNYEKEFAKMTQNFQSLVQKKFENYADKFDIIDMQPIASSCYEYNELYGYFLLKPKPTVKAKLNIEV